MPEPLPGIGPITGALEAFAQFFCIDPDLVVAAAESSPEPVDLDKAEVLRRYVEGLPEAEKTTFLLRLVEGVMHVAGEIRAKSRECLKSSSPARPLRTAGELRQRTLAVAAERERVEAERRKAERRRKAEEEVRARRARLDALRPRGESVWKDIEADIERRNAAGYESAAGLLRDMKALAEEQGTTLDFSRCLVGIRERHANKRRFIERLNGLV
jgi:hypothetical protein